MTPLDALARREQDKYRRFRALPRKNVKSPGRALAPLAWRMFGSPHEGTLVDYGCGECGAVDWFRERGLTVTGVDLWPVRDEVVETTLWAMGEEVPESDYAFSSDVFEHLPEKLVRASLRGIRARTRVSAVFQIATRPDKSGKLIGEHLHLTVRPPHWWLAELLRWWPAVTTMKTRKSWQTAFFCEVAP